MKNVTHVRIRATPAEIWPWVAHPDGVMRWNEKLVAHQAPPLEELHRGDRFKVTYRMSRPVETWAEVMAWEPGRLVEFRYRDDPQRSGRSRASGPRRGRLGPGRPGGRGPGGRLRRRSRERRGGDTAWMAGLGRDGWASESVRLEADGDGTRVERRLEIHAPKIPWPFRLLIGFFLRFGKPVDGTHLETLKAVVEGGGSPRTDAAEPGWGGRR